MAGKFLRVRTTTEIPYAVLALKKSANGKIEHVFAPDLEVGPEAGKIDEATAAVLEKTYPNIFEFAGTKTKPDGYRMKVTAVREDVVALFAQLSADDQVEFLKALKERVEEAKRVSEERRVKSEELKAKAAQVKTIQETLAPMTIAELEKFAEEQELEIPPGVERKADIVEWLVKNVPAETADVKSEE